jgi:hypothetical protein
MARGVEKQISGLNYQWLRQRRDHLQTDTAQGRREMLLIAFFLAGAVGSIGIVYTIGKLF